MRIKLHTQRILINFLAGFLIYIAIETIFRMVTGQNANENAYINLFLMGILGGIILNVLGGLDQFKLFQGLPFKVKSLLGGLIITASEFFAGLLINKVFGLEGWDYMHLFLGPLFLGQTCFRFFIIWILTAPFVYWVDSCFDRYHKIYNQLLKDGAIVDKKILVEYSASLDDLFYNYYKLLFAWGKNTLVK